MAVLLAAAMLSGCGLTDAFRDAGEPPSIDCAQLLSDPDAARPAAGAPASGLRERSVEGATVLLVDRSGSVRGDSTRDTAGAPDLVATLQPLVLQALRAGDQVSVGAFDGSAATITWAGRDLRARTHSNPSNREVDLKQATACVVERLRAAADQDPLAKGTDLLGALGEAGKRARAANRPRMEVVLATDGLANHGCVILSRVGSDPAGDCAPTGQLPDLRGIMVRLVGVGHPVAAQRPSDTGQLRWLKGFWERLCRDGMQAAKCTVETEISAPADPDPPGPTAVVDPPVRVPGVDEELKNRVWRITIDEPLLFATDKADLSPQAADVFAQVRSKVPAPAPGLPGTRIEVFGYTDSRGSDRHNRRLSEARAKAVADGLRALRIPGVARITAEGRGEPAAPEFLPGTHTLDPGLMRDNRRVEIFIHLPS